MRERTNRKARRARSPLSTRLKPLTELLEGRLVLSQIVVSPLGSDSGTGSASSPWRTLQHAAASIHPGDDVEVLAGTYAGFSMNSGGVSVAPITFRADPGAVITSPGPDGRDGIDLEGASYVTLDGFTVTGMPLDGIRAVGGQSVSISQDTVAQGGSWGIFAQPGAGFDLEGNVASGSASGGGIEILDAGPGAVIVGNQAWGNAGAGIGLTYDGFAGAPATSAVVSGNIAHDNAGAGLDLGGVQNSSIVNNLVYSGIGGGIALHPAGGVPSTGDAVAGNTVDVSAAGQWALSLSGGSVNTSLADDILIGTGGAGSVSAPADSLPGLSSNANVVSDRFSGGTSAITFGQWQAATGLDGLSFEATPANLFVNPSAGDFHLSTGSPAAGTGITSAALAVDMDGRARPAGSVAIGAFQPAPSAAVPQPLAASFIGSDAATQGNWAGKYGSDGVALLGYSNNVPGYATLLSSPHSQEIWSTSTADPRGLLASAGSPTRVATAWSSTTSFTIDVRPSDSALHRVTLYAVDWDNRGRSERIDVVDPATGNVLDSRTISSFAAGQYLTWGFAGHVEFRITNLAGPGTDAVVGGLFFDPPASGFLAADSGTQGNWVGHYGGAGGYDIFGGNSSLPPTIAVTPSNASSYVWNSSTSDPRALLQSPTATGRIASTWYTGSTMTIDVNMADGKAHQVALYALDWDGATTWDGVGRSERVDVVNAATGSVIDSETVSSFTGGRYLIWELSGHVQLVVTRLSGPNAVVSGLFFDASAPTAPVASGPSIVSSTPSDVPGLPGSTIVSATLSEAINPASVSLVLTDLQNAVIPSTVRYDATRHVVTLVPTVPLMENDRYTATLSGVVDASGNALPTTSWSFDVGKDPHATDPIKQAEHLAMFKLVQVSQATDIALKSGSWGDPSIWSDGQVPTTGDHVDIPEGIAVTVDGQFGQSRVQTLFVEGSLRFNTTVNTSLEVVTTVVGEDGYFEIGTAQNRVAPNVTAQFIIGNRGARDAAMQLADPTDLSGGFISHGTTSLYGSLYQSQATPTSVPAAGQASVSFAAAPTGWKVGDTLLFPGLSDSQDQDETRTVTGISADGLTFTLDSPLAYDHGGIYGYSQAAPVGDMTRNVVFSSEDSADIVDRGHVMFMHTLNEVIDSVAFDGLGRTSAQTQETFPKLDANGHLIPGTDANTAGRYAVHFHIRDGATYAETPAVITNSVIDTSPKIGIDNHGGYVLITDDLTYQVNGSGIFTENGSEIGVISGNMTVRSNGAPGNLDGRPGTNGDPNDYGFSGTGIWNESGGVAVYNNFSSGQSSAAFIIFENSIIDDTPSPTGYSVFLTQNLKDPSIADGAPWVDVDNVPCDFENNTGIGSTAGLITWDCDLFSVISKDPNVVSNSSFVNNATGWENAYSRDFLLTNDKFIGGDPANFGHAYYGSGIIGNIETANIVLDNTTIDGYGNDYYMPTHGDNEIHGGYINGINMITVPPAYGGTLIIDGVTWGTMPGQDPAKITLSNDYSSDTLKTLSGYLDPMQFTYNGQTVYYNSQAANFVPFENLSPLFDGLTNQQLWNDYGLAIGGRIAPGGLTAIPDIAGGMIGAAVPFEPMIQTTDLLYGQIYDWAVPQIDVYVPDNYSATVNVAGVTYVTPARNLNAGWNVITFATPGGKRSILVFSELQG